MKGTPAQYRAASLRQYQEQCPAVPAWEELSLRHTESPLLADMPAPDGRRLQLHRFPGESHAEPAYQFVYPDGRLGGWCNARTELGPGIEVPAGTEIRDSFVCAGTVFSGMRNILVQAQVKAPTRIHQCEIYGSELRGQSVANSLILDARRLEGVQLDTVVVDGAARLVHVEARGGAGFGGTPCFREGAELVGDGHGAIVISGDTDVAGVKHRGALHAASTAELQRVLAAHGASAPLPDSRSEANTGRSSVVSKDQLSDPTLFHRRRR